MFAVREGWKTRTSPRASVRAKLAPAKAKGLLESLLDTKEKSVDILSLASLVMQLLFAAPARHLYNSHRIWPS